MNDLGQISLLVAFALTAYALFASVAGAVWGRRRLAQSAGRALWVAAGLITLAVCSLWWLLVHSDFSNRYVWSVSNAALPFYYKMSALWAGQDGSLLLWTWLLSIFAALVLFQNRNRNRVLIPWVTAVLAGSILFFLTLNLWVANAFRAYHWVQTTTGTVGASFTPMDGTGLNPQLQNIYMVIHPPILYLGYVMFAVPFAFAIAALITGRLGTEWTRASRRWTLAAWFFLGFGIILGGHWAYEELGWGGYWAWDPVENASLMPWLMATAYLHSVMIQERRGMLKVWNMCLVILTYLLCIFGTFLTRSGVVSSVHSFAASNLGPLFMTFLTTTALFAFALLLWRLPLLKSENKMESMASRESSFLFNNLLFLVGCFAVFWGTLFPVFSEWFTGDKIQVGPPWFNKVMIPLGLLILLMMGVAPVFAWRRTSGASLVRNFMLPGVTTLVVAGGLYAFGMREMYAIGSLALCYFVLWVIVAEFLKGVAARRRSTREPLPTAVVRLIYTNHRRYGGYTVHFAVVLLFIGFTGMAFRTDAMARLDLEQSMRIKDYQLVLKDYRQGARPAPPAQPNYEYDKLVLDVYKDGKFVKQIQPERRQYLVGPRPTSTEVQIYNDWFREDLYVVFAGVDRERFVVNAYVNPLISWVWFGALMLIVGTSLCIIPNPEAAREKKRRAARVTPGLAGLPEGSVAD